MTAKPWDETTHEYHLTPSGWVEGTSFYFGELHRRVERPADAVESWVRHMVQRHGFAEEKVEWRRRWRRESVSDDEVQALLRKFPRPK